MKFWEEYFIPHDPVKELEDQGKRVISLQFDKRYNYTPIHCHNTMNKRWDELSKYQKNIVVKLFNSYNIPWC